MPDSTPPDATLPDAEDAVFGDAYADAYDALYRDKDYDAECDVLERAFAERADGPVRRILDAGCGTGGHALRLARRGYTVVGVDLSHAMLAHARAKAEPGLDVAFLAGDLRALPAALAGDGDGGFDAAVVLFAVLGYLVTTDDLRVALAGLRRALRVGGLLVFDGWYGPAVLADPPGERLRVLDGGDGKTVLRAASGVLDPLRHRCTVSYRLWTLDGDRVAGRAEERHEMRFFFPLELEALLTEAGFAAPTVGAFPDLDRPPDAASWTFIAAARAV